ncbi:hypothetical protein AC579_5901 [Pseudocercospora musae]|uniref:Phenylalanine--tRNA ligase beta subunit n=1 Tax=Pseudocercospora musae TaxID=113226 RepID=A0A139IT22_9PEZI|nr:hypothetical protein AC579_5901 [Pseudocercospora musae]
MPTIAVDKAALYKALGREYTNKEFDELCFDFGIELDEDTTDDPERKGAPELKIEIPANRYDMLCFEGIALNLNVFLGRQSMPKFTLSKPKELLTINITEDTARIRPYFSCAILRGITFDQARYDSFIALQDKLHQNLARQRTLVSIGTHDLSTIEGPFSYDALPPEEIKFSPLNQEKVMNGREMMEFYESDKHLSRYLHIIGDSPVYPIIYDKNRTVLSMPPIINSNHSKITLNTTDVFIDITATDKTKLEIVNHIICAMFSMYCTEPFTVEPVNVVSKHNGESRVTPDLSPRPFQASLSFINSVCGLEESPESWSKLLAKMAYDVRPSETDKDKLDIDIPITRADVLHQADIMEDAAIAYGFNKLPQEFPTSIPAGGAGLPINTLSDIVRLEAKSRWIEVMPLILCSHDENYAWLNQKDDGKAVRLANPKTAEYQIVRTSLVPGLIKTIRENRKHEVPLKIFEVADVCYKDASLERRSRNERHFAAAWAGSKSGFEQVQGLLDTIMLALRYPWIPEGKDRTGEKAKGYWVEGHDDPTYLAGHAAAIYLKSAGKQVQRIGIFGMLHPKVLENFEIPYAMTALELNLESTPQNDVSRQTTRFIVSRYTTSSTATLGTLHGHKAPSFSVIWPTGLVHRATALAAVKTSSSRTSCYEAVHCEAKRFHRTASSTSPSWYISTDDVHVKVERPFSLPTNHCRSPLVSSVLPNYDHTSLPRHALTLDTLFEQTILVQHYSLNFGNEQAYILSICASGVCPTQSLNSSDRGQYSAPPTTKSRNTITNMSPILVTISLLVSLTTAVPAPHHNKHHIEVSLPEPVTLAPRQQQCQVDSCTTMFRDCVKSCDSLQNADWYVYALNNHREWEVY